MSEKRRNLTGIYMQNILIEGKRGPICIADAPESIRMEWLSNLDRDRLEFIANVLAKEIRQLGDDLDVCGPENKETGCGT